MSLQPEPAARLGIAVSTLSRWETGAPVQQHSLDRFLRIFFADEVARNALANPDQVDPSLFSGRRTHLLPTQAPVPEPAAPR
jgi:hypothetical protein